MRRSLTAWLFSVLSIGVPTLGAQTPSVTACSDSLGRAMAFLEGHWQGHSYSVSGRDTALDGLMKVHSRQLFGRCALEEDWKASKDGHVLFTAKVIRAYDGANQRWYVYYIDDQLNSQVYVGRSEGARWQFFRTRTDKGVPVQVRLTWRPAKGGYEQLIERSRDGGANWVLGGFVRFQADPGGR